MGQLGYFWSVLSGGGTPEWAVTLNREIRKCRDLESFDDLVTMVAHRSDMPTELVGNTLLQERVKIVPAVNVDQRSVFVVHGRNELLRRAMFEFLRAVGLQPIEWTQAVALTGKGSPYIGEVLDAAFAKASAVVVLMTPDEVAYLQPQYGHGDNDPETSPAAQARPNVLFEAGMALGRDQKRTILVEVGDVRPFSDVGGRHVVRLSNSVAQRQELARRLQTAGCAADLSGSDWHIAGDFTPPQSPGGGLPLGRRVPSVHTARKPLEFDLRYVDKGGNRIDKLTVFNRGTEAAYEVQLAIPDGAALSLFRDEIIAKIPSGRSVTIDAYSGLKTMGGPPIDSAFEVSVSGRTGAGDKVVQDVFIDMNG